MKKRWILIGVVALAMVATACTHKEEVIVEEEISDAKKFKEEYESLNGTIREKDGHTIRTIEIPENNPMVYTSDQAIVDSMNDKNTFAVYFGFEDCPWCRSMISTLVTCANDLKINAVYYVNVKDIRDEMELKDGEVVKTKEGSEGYQQLLEKLDGYIGTYTLTDDNGDKVETGENRIFAPTIVIVKDGEPVYTTDGLSDSQEDAYEQLTEEMQLDMQDEIVEALSKIAKEPGCSVEKGC